MSKWRQSTGWKRKNIRCKRKPEKKSWRKNDAAYASLKESNKIRSGVDGVSKSVGNADIVYGKITYILDDVDGDILGIYDAKTGVLTQQFVYDSDLGWLLKWVEEI